jgi:hypothetical protein
MRHPLRFLLIVGFIYRLVFSSLKYGERTAGAINEATVQRSKPYPNKSEVESSYL